MKKHPLLIAQDTFNALLKIHERLYNNIFEVENNPSQFRKILIPLVIIVKKQCRALDKLEQHDRLCMKLIDRCRELGGDSYYQQDHYIQHTTNLMSIEHWKKETVGHLLSCCILAEKKGIQYTENEARTMLSLSKKDWDWLTEDGDCELGFFLAAAHNEPLSLYATEYMIDNKSQIPGNQPAKEKIAVFYGGNRP